MTALREVVRKDGQKPEEFALHSLRIGGAAFVANRWDDEYRRRGGRCVGPRMIVQRKER